jgi:hypothetical protein
MAQILDLGKIRFQYKGDWSAATEYQFNDVVNYKGSAYCYISTAKTTGTLTSNTTFWGLMAKGSNWEGTYSSATTYGLGSIVGYQGSLYQYYDTVASAGTVPTNTSKWSLFLAQSTSSNNVYYVAPHGTDVAGSGFTLNQPFLTIKYACQQVSAGSTIFVKTGTYPEQLPITVPQGVAIVGDNQRTVIVQPKSGNSDDGTTPNAQSTMFLMSDGSILNKMTFQGMTGWTPGGTASDITSSTIKGVFVRLNSASPVTTKSPYVLECAAIGSGAIGALVDGSVHASGNKSMLFHGYTCILDNGVGYWCKDNGKAEIVSCFTYYAYFGYATTGGGQIRALNGNNSYGTYGVVSQGFDITETAGTGQIYGSQLNFTTFTGNLVVGDTVTNGSGASAIITNVQTSSQKIYVGPITGTFTAGNTITSTSGGSFTLGSVSGQKDFLLVLSGLTSLPIPGASISITGDSSSYVIQSVSGSWTSTASVVSVTLAQQKPGFSTTGTGVTLRYKYSRVRLTGHDFLSIGTGGITTTNYPNTPNQAADQAKETIETFPGRVFFVNTDQDGNFRVGKYFAVNQATGSATLNANAFNLSGLTSLRLGSVGAQLGAQIDEFSTDGSLSQNSPTKVPTQSAVVTYVTNAITNSTNTIAGPSGTIYNQTGSTLTPITFTIFSNQNYGAATVWSLAGSPASNFALNSSTGTLTTTSNLSAGTYTVTIQAALGSGATLTKTITIVSATTIPVFPTTPFPGSVAPSTAVTYTQTQAQVASGTIAFTVSSGALPSWLTLNNTTGALTGTSPASPTGVFTTYIFTITATSSSGYIVNKTYTWTLYLGNVQGQTTYTTPGTYTWTAPSAVTQVSVLAIGGGGAGQDNWSNPAGSGGGLGWKNNITVIPGQSYTVVVGAGGTSTTTTASPSLLGGNSYFNTLATVAGYGGGNVSGANTNGPNANGYGGGYVGDGGGAGGQGTSYQGGGGAGGYTARGYNTRETWNSSLNGGGGGAYYSSTYGTGAGGGVGIYGPTGYPASGNPFYNPFQGYTNSSSDGSGGSGAHGGSNGYYGENPFSGTGQSSSNILGGTYGGGGGGPGTSWPNASGDGGAGALRIIWGNGRSWPSTNVGDVPAAGPA